MREGKVDITAGYDGEYGTVHIFSDEEREYSEEQMTLFG
jgi:PHP family Zn ribbon phosphoesterase